MCFIQLPGTNRRGPKGKAAPKRTVDHSAEGRECLNGRELIFCRVKISVGSIWAHSSKCLICVKGSKCCARRSGWSTTAVSKGEWVLITASDLRKKELRSSVWYCHCNTTSDCLAVLPRWACKPLSMNPLQCGQGFYCSSALSEHTFHHFKALYPRAFLLLVKFFGLLRS